jgi:hypothetical protein
MTTSRTLLASLLAALGLTGCGFGNPNSRGGFKRPTSAKAVVTDEFINGFGGDPAVDYRYVAAGRRYVGYAVSGWDYDRKLRRGDRITITYDAAHPGRSCLC